MSLKPSIRRALDRLRGPLRPRLLISGMPKSGTTALARVLGEAAGFTVVSDPFFLLDTQGVDYRDDLYGGRISIGHLVDRHRPIFRGDLVKDPNFIFFADALLGRFPDAGFVFIVRDPRANIRSILNRLGLSGRPTGDGSELEQISDTWRRVLEGRTPDLDCSDYIECAAARWREAARIYLEHRDRLTLVRYEDFNRDKPGVVAEVLARHGVRDLRPVEHMMDRQFQPAGRRGVDWGEFFGEEGLARIEEDCGAEMLELGYERGRRSVG